MIICLEECTSAVLEHLTADETRITDKKLEETIRETFTNKVNVAGNLVTGLFGLDEILSFK